MRPLITLLPATLILAGSGTSAEPGGPIRTELQTGCVDCQYLGYFPEENEEMPYGYELGEWDCEDGYSPNGPCPPCEGVGCDSGYVWAAEEDLCNHECYNQIGELEALAVAGLRDQRVSPIAHMLTTDGSRVRLNTQKALLEFVLCDGSIVRTLTVPSDMLKHLVTQP